MSNEFTIALPGLTKMAMLKGALSSCAIEGNQLAIDCLETLRRIEAREPVGMRYVAQLQEVLT